MSQQLTGRQDRGSKGRTDINGVPMGGCGRLCLGSGDCGRPHGGALGAERDGEKR